MAQLSVSPNSKPGYALSNGIIRFKGRMVMSDNKQLKRQILQFLHSSPLGGHSSIRATYIKVRQLFFWPSLKKTVIEYVLACEVCQCCKHEQVANPGLL